MRHTVPIFLTVSLYAFLVMFQGEAATDAVERVRINGTTAEDAAAAGDPLCRILRRARDLRDCIKLCMDLIKISGIGIPLFDLKTCNRKCLELF